MSDVNQPDTPDRAWPSRPAHIDDLKERLSLLRTDESRDAALAFQPLPTDVFIATYPKSGTTWMQQIVHGLRTRGAMDFDEITEVVPWIESAHDMGLDMEGPQVAAPRAFKTHLSWDEVPEGGRYIYVMRDPKDVLISFYRFFEGWMFVPGTISLETFAREFFIPGTKSGRYWDHIVSWWPQRDRDDVLMLCFEDMKRDLAPVVRRVAAFIGVAADQPLLELVTHQASFAFMRAHERQFDDHLVRQARDAACGLPPAGVTTKIRTGRVGDHVGELSADLCEALDALWHELIAEPFGLRSYEELRARVAL